MIGRVPLEECHSRWAGIVLVVCTRRGVVVCAFSLFNSSLVLWALFAETHKNLLLSQKSPRARPAAVTADTPSRNDSRREKSAGGHLILAKVSFWLQNILR